MNPTFKIESQETGVDKKKLLLVVGTDTVSFIISGNNDECLALHSYHLPADTNAETLSNHVKTIASGDLLSDSFEKITIVYSLPSAIIAPADSFSEESKQEMIDLVFGDQTDALIQTDEAKNGRQVIYALPKSTESVASYLFSKHQSKHLYSLLPLVEGLNATALYCIFCNTSFIVMLQKRNELQVIQIYQYRSPEDVAYYLLHLCESFQVMPDAVTVYLNGMIGENSNLYNEICKYFLNIHFCSLPVNISYPAGINDYPSHYFSHLFALAQCV